MHPNPFTPFYIIHHLLYVPRVCIQFTMYMSKIQTLLLLEYNVMVYGQYSVVCPLMVPGKVLKGTKLHQVLLPAKILLLWHGIPV